MVLATSKHTKVRNFKILVLTKHSKLNCQYCEKKLTLKESTVDHFFPLARGGSDSFHNYRISCNDCNSKKGHEFFTFDPGCLLNHKEIEVYELIGITMKPLLKNNII